MTLLPDADVTEVFRRAAGLLEHLPWAPWHVPHPEALHPPPGKSPAGLFEALFWRAAGPIAAPQAPGMRWNGLLLCALDGFQTRVPDTPANREYLGSSGIADNSSPFPQARAIVVTAAGTWRAGAGVAQAASTGQITAVARRGQPRPGDRHPRPGVLHGHTPWGHPRDDPDPHPRRRLRRGARRRSQPHQPPHPGRPAARPVGVQANVRR
jgi:hypothetical protein